MSNQLQETGVAIENWNWLWLISLLILCLVILAHGYLCSDNMSNNLAYLSSYNLGKGLVIWLIFHFMVGRTKGKCRATISFFVIWISLIISGLIGYSQNKIAAKQMTAEFLDSVSVLNEKRTDEHGVPRPIEVQLNTIPKTRGEIGEIERIAKTFMNGMISLRNNYLSELDTIGWSKILDVERIKHDDTFFESKQMAQKAKDAISKYKDQTYIFFANQRKDVDNFKLKFGSTGGFDEGLATSRFQIDMLCDLETQIISKFGNIFILLEEKKGLWQIKDGKILFDNNNNLTAFNSYLTTIKELGAKQEAFQKQCIENATDALNKTMN